MTNIESKLSNLVDTKSGKDVITLKDAGQLVGCGTYYQMYCICNAVLKDRKNDDIKDTGFYLRTRQQRDCCLIELAKEAYKQGFVVKVKYEELK